MNRRSFAPLRLLAIAFLAVAGASPSLAQEAARQTDLAADLRQYIPKILEEWKMPGTAVLVVRGDQVILAEGYGFRDLEKKLPVTPQTVFPIGSVTKAFTALTVGMMVDDGKLAWDKPVRSYIPSFRLRDPYATEHLTPRDLLSHRSGLPRHDLMWYGSPFSRAELFGRLAELEPNADLRTRFQYQNLMYMAAGQLVGQVSGRSWEDVVRERIFAPLGMRDSSLTTSALAAVANRSLGYREKEESEGGGIEEMPLRAMDATGPAGSINSNVLDLAKWVRLQLGDGTFEGKRIVSEAALRETHTPQMIIPESRFLRNYLEEEQSYMLYGMGWYIHPFRGRTMLQHGGNIDGFSSFIGLLPRDKVGVVVLSSLSYSDFPYLLAFHVLDRALGLPEKDWDSTFWKQRREGEAAEAEQEKLAAQERKLGTRPSHPLEDYAGLYSHPAYGDLRIVRQGRGISYQLNGLSGDLDHWHYDTWNIPSGEARGVKVTFLGNALGEIASVSIPLEESVGPIVFTRRPSSDLTDRRRLQQYVGDYELSGQTATVALRDGALTLMRPGQPVYELEADRETVFNVKNLKGYSVRFIVEAGEVTGASFIQPNGVVKATKKRDG